MDKERLVNILYDHLIKVSDSELSEALTEGILALNNKPELKSDGTLVVNTEEYPNVKRILLGNKTDGTLYYPEGAKVINIRSSK